LRSRLIFGLGAYSPHPEQDAQQSAEGHHAALAAFTAAVGPNASKKKQKSGKEMMSGVTWELPPGKEKTSP
jgi:hypothetical protein